MLIDTNALPLSQTRLKRHLLFLKSLSLHAALIYCFYFCSFWSNVWFTSTSIEITLTVFYKASCLYSAAFFKCRSRNR